MKKSILSLLAIGLTALILFNCSKEETPSPSNTNPTTGKVTAETKTDVKKATQSSAKISSVRTKTSSISNKVNKKARLALARKSIRPDSIPTDPGTFPGGNFTMPGDNMTMPGVNTMPRGDFGSFPGGNFTFTGDNGGYPEYNLTDTGMSFDTTGLGGAQFTNGDLASLDNELDSEFGGKTSVTIIGGNMEISVDFGTGTDNPDKSADAPAKLSGKMVLKMDIGGGGDNIVTTVQFVAYKEDFKNDSLDFTMDGSMTMGMKYDATGANSTITSTFNLNTTSLGIVTSLKGSSTIIMSASSMTEDGDYEIKEGSTTFKYVAKGVVIPITGCDKNFGIATKGTATITEGSESINIDYGTGDCDTKVKVTITVGTESVSEELDLLGSDSATSTTSGTNLK
ncbi:MAG: hypothetical protein NW207_03005 [Cytophagales bacterium]|nr:hypothetical protein [Cytophagales bacterium]